MLGRKKKAKKTKTPKTSPAAPPHIQEVILPILGSEGEAWVLKAERALSFVPGIVLNAEDGPLKGTRIWTITSTTS